MHKELKNAIAKTPQQMTAIFEIRREVFVKEQSVSEDEEYDDYEDTSIHLAAYFEEQMVGTCRYRTTNKGVKLERFAVLKRHRKDGVGGALLQFALNQLDDLSVVYLHAQVQVVDFYGRYGFSKVGEQFEEAGIQHFKMVYSPNDC